MPPRLQVITGRLARSHLNRLTQQQQEEKKFLLATFVDRKEKDFLLGEKTKKMIFSHNKVEVEGGRGT